jgi:transcriptional regulator with AAA-type ATPase domain
MSGNNDNHASSTKPWGIIGECEEIKKILDLIDRLGPEDPKSVVLVLGESGTGKELIARALHSTSKRTGSFLAVNCAAIPETLLESELFGHEPLAFNDAKLHRGYFERADLGTLFLDEVGYMPTSTQVKLLRVLEERSFERVGGEKTIKVDVRIVAATNRDLKARVQSREFREDLYYRLECFSLAVPPLRARGDDIVLLADRILHRLVANQHPKKFSTKALLAMKAYSWPGNVRELENAVKRAKLGAGDLDEIELERLDEGIQRAYSTRMREIPTSELPAAGQALALSQQDAGSPSGCVAAAARALLTVSPPWPLNTLLSIIFNGPLHDEVQRQAQNRGISMASQCADVAYDPDRIPNDIASFERTLRCLMQDSDPDLLNDENANFILDNPRFTNKGPRRYAYDFNTVKYVLIRVLDGLADVEACAALFNEEDLITSARLTRKSFPCGYTSAKLGPLKLFLKGAAFIIHGHARATVAQWNECAERMRKALNATPAGAPDPNLTSGRT